MSSSPLVSVIVIFFNTEKFIQEAIESVFAQTYDKWELLLVDDGSSDDSTRIALHYAAQFPEKVRYMEHLDHQNRGASASRNLGIKHAKGDILAFLDSDDVWLPQKLQEQVAILDSHPEATVLYGNTQCWYSWTENTTDNQRDHVPELVFQTDTLVKPPTLLMKNYPLGRGEAPSFSNLVLRREVVDRVGGFEERFKRVYTDQAFVTKVYLTESVFVAGERPYWDKYRQHPDSACSVMWSTGQYWYVRQDFLDWLEEYLRNEEIHDPEVWRLLRESQLEAQLRIHKKELRKEREEKRRLQRRVQELRQRVNESTSASTNRARQPNSEVVEESRRQLGQSVEEMSGLMSAGDTFGNASKELPMEEWITKVFDSPDLRDPLMGHAHRVEDLNLGLGWLYYALARIIRPTTAVVIGSWRGFVPLVFGKALADNSDGGEVLFIDPSLADDFWKDPQRVRDHFATFGVTNVRHFLMTTQQFVESGEYRALDKVGIVFVDGYHSKEQARFDYEAFQGLLAPNGVILFHDSVRIKRSEMYGPDRAYEMDVKLFIDKLKENPGLQVFDLPFDGGVTLVRKARGSQRRSGYEAQLQGQRTRIRNHSARLNKLERALKQERRKARRLRLQVQNMGEQLSNGWKPNVGRLSKRVGHLRARILGR